MTDVEICYFQIISRSAVATFLAMLRSGLVLIRLIVILHALFLNYLVMPKAAPVFSEITARYFLIRPPLTSNFEILFSEDGIS